MLVIFGLCYKNYFTDRITYVLYSIHNTEKLLLRLKKKSVWIKSSILSFNLAELLAKFRSVAHCFVTYSAWHLLLKGQCHEIVTLFFTIIAHPSSLFVC